ncbi:hypothetical protein CAOG_06968 [Capsaspora owczarzaki ATCC 30864]|uniref:hypothetical protein n=1 Tax=Capsaspora owczarzaki (strain ATCC 30864) TaxID=595528 RepID=UPI0003525C52|nr:hypothetical protein CAOG_06968 [Capsaspora owczarzaki ATCC 30864]|eukprot:XP_004343692.2 hypothetical protein CAOG_06968 [Capsaspora owczarzaki ATCC 30864]
MDDRSSLEQTAKTVTRAHPEHAAGWSAGGGWGEYMRIKKAKLDQQFEDGDESSSMPRLSSVLAGVRVYVDGYTTPPAAELKHLLWAHGGTYEHYNSKSRVTHIVACNLPDTKLKQLTNEKVMRPEWIVDSIAQGRLLPEDKYRLYSGRVATQPALMQMLPIANKHAPHAARSFATTTTTTTTTALMGRAGQAPSLAADAQEAQSMNVNPLPLDQSATTSPPETVDSDQDSAEEFDNDEFLLMDDAELLRALDQQQEGEGAFAESEHSIAPAPASSSSSSSSKNNASTTTAGAARPLGDRAATMTTLGNPSGFMSRYYQTSRLHFLSTWAAEVKTLVAELLETSAAKDSTGDAPMTVEQLMARSFRDKGAALPPIPGGKVLAHVDMDCFFVSASLLSRPHLVEQPVVVCHSSSTDLASTSEIASCNYPARAKGVRNGMRLGDARQLCDNITCVPYEFEVYRDVMITLYKTLVSYTTIIQAVSCDEAYIDITELVQREIVSSQSELPSGGDAQAAETDHSQPPPVHSASWTPSATQIAASIAAVVSRIRQEIATRTGCPVSAGIAHNMLLARMATKRAKPSGQFYLAPHKGLEFMLTQAVGDLPGVGWSLARRLAQLDIETCSELARISKDKLQAEFGKKIGETLFNFARGVDMRQLKTHQARQSVSVEITWGVRFEEEAQVRVFVTTLSRELERRMAVLNVTGKSLHIHLMVRKPGITKVYKYLGHGVCDSYNRSTLLATPTRSADVIFHETMALLADLKFPPCEYRGLGIQLTKLTGQDPPSVSKPQSGAITRFFSARAPGAAPVESTSPAPVTHHQPAIAPVQHHPATVAPLAQAFAKTRSPRVSAAAPAPCDTVVIGDDDILPPMSQLDPAVLEALPEEVRLGLEADYRRKTGKSEVSLASRPRSVLQQPKSTSKPEQVFAAPVLPAMRSKRRLTTSTVDNRAAAAAAAARASPPPQAAQADHVPSPSQWDPEVIRLLPPEVVKEMYLEYNALVQRKEEASSSRTSSTAVPADASLHSKPAGRASAKSKGKGPAATAATKRSDPPASLTTAISASSPVPNDVSLKVGGAEMNSTSELS